MAFIKNNEKAYQSYYDAQAHNTSSNKLDLAWEKNLSPQVHDITSIKNSFARKGLDKDKCETGALPYRCIEMWSKGGRLTFIRWRRVFSGQDSWSVNWYNDKIQNSV